MLVILLWINPADCEWTIMLTSEDIYGGLAKYYDLPWLSLRAATYRLSVFLKDERFSWDKIMNSAVAYDYVHPSVGENYVCLFAADVWCVGSDKLSSLPMALSMSLWF